MYVISGTEDSIGGNLDRIGARWTKTAGLQERVPASRPCEMRDSPVPWCLLLLDELVAHVVEVVEVVGLDGGIVVEVANYSNLNAGLAYFVNAEGQITVLNTIDGVAFGGAEEEEEEE